MDRLKFFWPYLGDNKNPTFDQHIQKSVKYGVYNNTPLHFLAIHGMTEIVKFMLDHLKDPNPANTLRRMTPLHQASRNGHVEIVKLITDKVDCWDQNLISEYNGYTPLHFAAQYGHLKCVKTLVERWGSGPWINIKTTEKRKENSTALGLAKKEKHMDVVKFLERIH